MPYSLRVLDEVYQQLHERWWAEWLDPERPPRVYHQPSPVLALADDHGEDVTDAFDLSLDVARKTWLLVVRRPVAYTHLATSMGWVSEHGATIPDPIFLLPDTRLSFQMQEIKVINS